MDKVGTPKHKSQKARLIVSLELLKTLNAKELENFDDYINCNYHNTNKKLCLLFKKLRQYALKTEIFNDEIQLKIYHDVFAKAKNQKILNTVQKKELNKAMNHLLELAESFLMVEQLKQNEAIQYELLFPQLISREQFILYNRRLKTKQKELEKKTKRGLDYYTTSYNLQKYQSGIFYIGNRFAKEDNFNEIQFNLDVKYLLEILRYHLVKISLQKRFAHKQFDFAPYKAIENLVKLDQYKSIPLIQLYLLNINLVEKDDNETFQLLFDTLIKQHELIPTKFLKVFYTNLTNYCAIKIREGDLQFYRKTFDIYISMHNLDVLTTRNVREVGLLKNIDVGLLKNIITIACWIKEFEWANTILKCYINNVFKEIRQSVFHYNKGIIAFNQYDYSNALIYFNKAQKIDDTHDIGVRISRLKCFYEIDKIYEITTQKIIDNIKVYFASNKRLTENEKKMYKNFIIIFNKLYKFKDIPDKRDRLLKIKLALPIIKQDLSNISLLAEKQWLINKIDALEMNKA